MPFVAVGIQSTIMNGVRLVAMLVTSLLMAACAGPSAKEKKEQNAGGEATVATAAQTVSLPSPYATESVRNFSNVIGWEEGQTPKAPDGFTVTKFADSLENPRWIYVTPGGDILVAESNKESGVKDKVKAVVAGKTKSQNDAASANRITLFRDADGDGKYDHRSVF
jgi:glucose/arabinose dehydrogenase